MRQRLGLATALLGDPEVLVLDEPANGLDPAGIRWLRDFLRSLAAEGRTILVSSHVLAEVAQTVDRVVIIHRGKLIQQATIAEVLAGAQGATRVRTPDAERLRELLAAQGATVSETTTAPLAVDLPPERVGELAAANGIVLHELDVEQRDARGGLPRADRRGDDRVTALVRSELLKIRTTRGWCAYLAVIVLLVGIAVAGRHRAPRRTLERSTLDFQLGLVDLAGIAALLAIILGITIVTTEFRHGTITPTLLAEPRRERVLAAKAVAETLVARLLRAARARGRGRRRARSGSRSSAADLHFGDADVGKRAAQTVLLGGPVGAPRRRDRLRRAQPGRRARRHARLDLPRRDAAARALRRCSTWTGCAAYLPFQALDGADGSGGDDLLSYWPAVAVSLGWIALIGAAGIVRTRRRDIS